MTSSAVSTLKNTCHRNDSIIVSVFVPVSPSISVPVSPIVSLAPFSCELWHNCINRLG